MSAPDIDDLDLDVLLQAEAEYQKYNQLYHYFAPGPFSIEHYPRHKELFDAGAKFRHRCLMGGNGCITPWTKIETVEGEVPILELVGKACFAVRSWDGESRCVSQATGVFLKEFSQAFRVHLDNGQWFDCNRTHRVLTCAGWISFDQLVRSSSGLRWSQTNADSLGSCQEDRHCYDEQPLLGKDSGQAKPPLAVYAQKLSQCLRGQKDAVEHKLQCIRACQQTFRPSSRIYDRGLVLALCEMFADPTAELDARWCSKKLQAAAKLATVSGPHQEGFAPLPAKALSIASGHWPEDVIGGGIGGWLFCPSSHPELVGGNRIVSIIPLGVQPILDLTVSGTQCYLAAGVVHHNTGKTILGSFETALHVTGLYPDWWEGLRFDTPIVARVCGDTRETVRDITQAKLLGPFVREGNEALGTGIIPRSLIGKPKLVQNTNGSVDFVPIRHVSGEWSTIEFRAYEQGRKAFQGTERHWIWEDEEPPQQIHEENVHRTRGVDGRVLLTYTPLSGFTDVVESFLKWEKANKEGASRYTVFCGWDDVPHLSEDWKRQTLAETLPHMRKTRKSGVPLAGVGMVYPVEEDLFVVRPFEIPPHWRRVFGFDHGWHNTAAGWFAYDKDEDVVYLYSEYKRGEVSLEQHSIAIKARGEWIPGIGDVAHRESDGKKIIDKYKALGVRIKMADKSVDPGIQEVFSRLESGRLKIFSTCHKWLDEFRRYRYDDNQKIVKENDHLMDVTRYVCNGGLKLAIPQPARGGIREIVSKLSF